MTRKIFAHAQAARSRILFLPMPRAEVDALMLQHRMALEAARGGYGNASITRRLYIVILMSRYLTEDGHGLLELATLGQAEHEVAAIFERGDGLDDWRYTDETIGLISMVMNEYDRQLRETRLQAVVRANERLERLIAHGAALAVANGKARDR
jgi:hypothetical protein